MSPDLNLALSDAFISFYCDCALWSSNDWNEETRDDTPFSENYGIDDIDPETLKQMIEDCQSFMADAGDMIDGHWSQAGHDFWLTRNGHGAGFWCRSEVIRKRFPERSSNE
jgi:hypothetical protein